VLLDPLKTGWRLTFQPTVRPYVVRSGEPLRYPERDRRADQDWLRFPVVGISWDDALAYTAWLDRTGRLPRARPCTEREWERAARGADDRRFPHGNRLAPDDANHDATYGRKPLAFGLDEVGSHPASDSPFGVADLAGNAWELARSADAPGEIVLRGGGFYQDQLSSRVNNRTPAEAAMRSAFAGLRVCADALLDR
jgi:eukaryotic-like serine/threonine-protein kinase